MPSTLLPCHSNAPSLGHLATTGGRFVTGLQERTQRGRHIVSTSVKRPELRTQFGGDQHQQLQTAHPLQPNRGRPLELHDQLHTTVPRKNAD